MSKYLTNAKAAAKEAVKKSQKAASERAYEIELAKKQGNVFGEEEKAAELQRLKKEKKDIETDLSRMAKLFDFIGTFSDGATQKGG